MSKEEIKTVFDGIRTRKAKKTPRPIIGPDDKEDEKSVYIAWRDMLRYKYGFRIPEYHLVRNQNWYRTRRFAAVARGVIEYLDENVPNLRGIKREAAITKLISCCVFSDEERTRITKWTLLGKLQDVAGSVEAAYPGYADHGMLPLVLCESNCGRTRNSEVSTKHDTQHHVNTPEGMCQEHAPTRVLTMSTTRVSGKPEPNSSNEELAVSKLKCNRDSKNEPRKLV